MTKDEKRALLDELAAHGIIVWRDVGPGAVVLLLTHKYEAAMNRLSQKAIRLWVQLVAAEAVAEISAAQIRKAANN